MLPDVHLALQRLLFDQGRIPADEVDVRFEAPTREWVDTLTRPTINLFLCDVQENTELRNVTLETARGNGQGRQGRRVVPPRRIDLLYIVSAVTTEIDDEHRLLWRTLVTLMRYPRFPAETLPDALRGLDPPLVAQIVQPKDSLRPMDVWSALGTAPRPALCYTITAPLDLDLEFAAPLVLTRTARYRSITEQISAETRLHIGGVVRGADGQPRPGVTVSLEGRALNGSMTNEEGWFTLRGVAPGTATLRAAAADGSETTLTVQVPSESYDITLE